MSSNYFVQLTESGQTVNLSQIASVSWHEVPDGWEESGCEATITMSNGCYTCITPADAQELWEALNRYNTRMGQALAALPQLVRALSQFLEELGQVAHEPSDTRDYPPPTSRIPNTPAPSAAQGQAINGNGSGKARGNISTRDEVAASNIAARARAE